MYENFVMMKYYATSKREELDAALESDNYALQMKIDGSGYTLCVDPDGIPHLHNGKISKKTGELVDKIENVPHIKEWALANMPKESQLCVELSYNYDWTSGEPVYHQREHSKYLNSIMLSLPPKAVARQKQTQLVEMNIFDCLFWAGEEVYKLDFADRWAVVKNLWERYVDPLYGYDHDGNTHDIIPYWAHICKTIYKNKAEVIAGWLNSGFEGGVLKMLHSEGKVDASYHVRKIGETAARPRHTSYKIKEVDTVDAVITQIYMPTSEYTGKDPENHPYKDENGKAINRLYALGYANAFGIGVYKDGELVQIGTVASGLDDEERLVMAKYPQHHIGKVVELVCMSKDNIAGTLRHPRLLCFRGDKTAEECTFETVFN